MAKRFYTERWGMTCACAVCDGMGQHSLTAGAPCWGCGGTGMDLTPKGQQLVEFLRVEYGLVPLKFQGKPRNE